MEERIEILTRKDMEQPEWKRRAEHSVRITYGSDAGDRTEEAGVQEMLLQFVKNMGGIRKDVYEYLLTPRFHDAEAVTSIGMLLCYGAPVEWIELAADIFEKNRIAATLYVNEITEAYKGGVSAKQIRSLLNSTETVFEFCQRRLHNDYPQMSEGKKAESFIMEKSELEETITSAVYAAMQAFTRKTETEEATEVTEETEATEETEVTETEIPEETESGKDSGTVPEEKGAVVEDPEDGYQPEIQKEEFDILNNRSMLIDLEKAAAGHSERVSFFQILLSRHMKRVFGKLDKETQVGKIFEIMIEKKYKREKILAVKQLMDGGMTNEFIFSLLEKDLPEEELKELCETLVEDMPQGTEEADTEDMANHLEVMREGD